MNCIVLYITGLFSTQTKFYEKLASVYIKLRTPQISNQIYQNQVRIRIRNKMEMSISIWLYWLF